MKISEKTKKAIGISIGVSVVGAVACAGLYYYYYRKPEDELGYDEIEQLRFPKMVASRWERIDTEYEDLDNVNDRMRRRDRFTVYSKENSSKDNSSFDGKVEKRFKILRTDESVIGRTGRFRTSGERYKHTPSGYNFNRNKRNATLNDLIIP